MKRSASIIEKITNNTIATATCAEYYFTSIVHSWMNGDEVFPIAGITYYTHYLTISSAGVSDNVISTVVAAAVADKCRVHEGASSIMFVDDDVCAALGIDPESLVSSHK